MPIPSQRKWTACSTRSPEASRASRLRSGGFLDEVAKQKKSEHEAGRGTVNVNWVLSGTPVYCFTVHTSRLSLALLPPPSFRRLVLINLLPDFLAVLDAHDREAAYRQYREAHRPILDAYWLTTFSTPTVRTPTTSLLPR